MGMTKVAELRTVSYDVARASGRVCGAVDIMVKRVTEVAEEVAKERIAFTKAAEALRAMTPGPAVLEELDARNRELMHTAETLAKVLEMFGTIGNAPAGSIESEAANGMRNEYLYA